MYARENSPLVVWIVGVVGGMLSLLLIPPVQAQVETGPACSHIRGSGPPGCIAWAAVQMHEEPIRPITARTTEFRRRPAPFRPTPQHAVSFREGHAAHALRSRRDPWIARDKALHLSYSFLWTLSSQYVLTHKTPLSHDQSVPWAITSGVTIGLTKELYDHRRPRNAFSWRDMAANAVGIGLATGLILL